MNFGRAIELMQAGKAVRRAGWNGKGMWVAMTPGTVVPYGQVRSGAAKLIAENEPFSEITILPHIDMRAADGSLVIGWLASQTDMLADDWELVEFSRGSAPTTTVFQPFPADRCPDGHLFSRAISQPYPRRCLRCGERETRS